MAITYATTTITAINDGDSITSAVLMGPSNSLSARTDEIKRNSDYDDYKKSYHEETLVHLTPQISTTGTESSTLTIHSIEKSNGASTPVNYRYFKISMSNACLSLYSKNLPNGRYTIQPLSFSGFFNDSVDNQELNVLSRYLVYPGDGVFLKVPVRSTGGDVTASNYADEVVPQTKDELDSWFTTSASHVSPANLVKLPELVEIEIFGLTASGLTTSINTAFGNATELTVASDGTVSLSNSCTLRLSGVEGSRGNVASIVDNSDSTGVIVTVTAATAPISIHTDSLNKRTANGDLEFKAIDNSNLQVGTWSVSGSSGYLVKNRNLDPKYEYIPLVRLTETGIVVGDRHFSLLRYYNQADSQVELRNSYGRPVGEVTGTGLEKSFSIDLLHDAKPIELGEHTIKLNKPELVSGELIASNTQQNDAFVYQLFKKLKEGGTTLRILRARLMPTDTMAITMGGGMVTDIELYIYVNTTSLTPNQLKFSATTEISLPSSALSDVGAEIMVYPQSGSQSFLQVAASNSLSALEFVAKVVNPHATGVMTGGDFYCEIDIRLS